VVGDERILSYQLGFSHLLIVRNLIMLLRKFYESWRNLLGTNYNCFPSIVMKVTNLQFHSSFLALVDSNMLHAALCRYAQRSFAKLRMRETESDVI
jgi:hypothetical protein